MIDKILRGIRFIKKNHLLPTILFLLTIPVIISLILVQQDLRQRAEDNAPLTEKDWKTYSELKARGKQKSIEKVLEVTLKYESTKNPSIKVLKTEKKNGFYRPQPPDDEYEYILKLQDDDGKSIFELKFAVPKDVHVVPPINPDEVNHGKIGLSSQAFVLKIPWKDYASSISVSTKQNEHLLSYNVSKVEDINNQPTFKSLENSRKLLNKSSKVNFVPFIKDANAQSLQNEFNLVFIGDKYTDLSIFHTDVSRFSTYLLQYEPFKSRPNDIRFTYVDNIGSLDCNRFPGIDRAIVCDTAKAAQLVNDSGAPYDRIYIISNDPIYGGAVIGQYGASFNGVGGNDYAKAPPVFVHELAHSFAEVADEYLLDDSASLNDKTNCYSGTPPNPAWEGIVPHNSYFLGCSKSYWYRSSETSIMRGWEGSPFYNLITQKIINDKLNFYSPSKPYFTPTPIVGATNTPTPVAGAYCGAPCTGLGTNSSCSGAVDGCNYCFGSACINPNSPSPTQTPTPKPELCGNGIDDNNNGQIDENCPVESGQLNVTPKCNGSSSIFEIAYPPSSPGVTSVTVIIYRPDGSALQSISWDTFIKAVTVPYINGQYRVFGARVPLQGGQTFVDNLYIAPLNCTLIPTPTFTPTPSYTPTPTRTPTPTFTLTPTPQSLKPGDVNGDGSVNLTDLSILLTNWNSTYAQADFNKDGTVGIVDLSILLSNWGT